jgi:predicted DNA-binding WGR domain protein
MSATLTTLELTESDPHNACFIAQDLLDQGDLKAAIKQIRRATTRFPDSGLAWNDRSSMLLLAERPKEALLAARRAAKLMRKSAQPWGTMGDALMDLGRPEEATEAWERALRLGNHPDREALQARLERTQRGLDDTERLSADQGTWRGFHHEIKERFWAIRLEGAGNTTREGNVGEKGRKTTRRFSSAKAARIDARKRIADKTRHGFVEVAQSQQSASGRVTASSEPKRKERRSSAPRTSRGADEARASRAKQSKAKQPKAKQPKAKQPKAKQPKAKKPKQAKEPALTLKAEGSLLAGPDCGATHKTDGPTRRSPQAPARRRRSFAP